MGFQILPTLLCWRICQTNSRGTLGVTGPRHRVSTPGDPEIPPKAWGKDDRILSGMASHLPDTSNARIGSEGTSSFLMFLKEYWLRELYLGLKVTASFDRSKSYTRVIDGQVRCITPEIKPRNLQVIWNVQFITVFVPAWMILLSTTACAGKTSKTRVPPVQ